MFSSAFLLEWVLGRKFEIQFFLSVQTFVISNMLGKINK